MIKLLPTHSHTAHTRLGFLIHVAVMVAVAFAGGRIVSRAVDQTILKIAPPAKVNKEAFLVISPASATVLEGSQFSVQVVVYPGSVNINAVGATLRYPANLEIVKISREGSFCTLYPEEYVKAQERLIRIGCGTPSPGLTEPSGIAGTVVFKARTPGYAQIDIDHQASSVHANDGQGTNVLSRVEGASLSILRPATPSPKAKPPEEVIVTSSTHPNQNIWYNKNTLVLKWIMREGILGYATLLDNDPQRNPDPASIEKINAKEFENLPDGTWYFHIRAKNEAGLGPVSHFKIQIDTVAPELNAQSSTADITEGNPVTISFSSEDAEYFLMEVDNESFEQAVSPVVLADLPRGYHDIYIRAVDRAENITERSVTVYVESRNPIERFFDWLGGILFNR